MPKYKCKYVCSIFFDFLCQLKYFVGLHACADISLFVHRIANRYQVSEKFVFINLFECFEYLETMASFHLEGDASVGAKISCQTMYLIIHYFTYLLIYLFIYVSQITQRRNPYVA